ncbi:hypothetical protein D9758_010238 [Tetrapyrgos nigripes]|uniref:AMP-dependent synthetase/ligase domain-containing protein n=1 Tax=Tetrapyrgos nigripes TaxID=182062 RepID=A0A8H5CXG5_9AGAR|nr:hypothetical protein D9758_010238 [Tetrapyrgos nigripes]
MIKPFPISTFLPPDTIAQLIQGNNIHRIITTDATLHSFLVSIRENLDLTYRAECIFEEAPGLSILYPKLGRDTSQDDFSPLSNPFFPTDEGKDLALCMHSSGSTGVPKTIRFTHHMIHQTGRKSRLTSLSGKPIRIAGFGFLLLLLLLFHSSAVFTLIASALYGPSTIAVFPPAVTQPGALPVTATPDNTIDHLKRTKATAILCFPHFISMFARDEKAIEVLRELDYVITGGGFVPTNAGDQLVSRGVRLRVTRAATECGGPTLISTEDLDPEDWSAFAFTKRVKVRWIPYGGGLFRCQFLVLILSPLNVMTINYPQHTPPDFYAPPSATRPVSSSSRMTPQSKCSPPGGVVKAAVALEFLWKGKRRGWDLVSLAAICGIDGKTLFAYILIDKRKHEVPDLVFAVSANEVVY